MPSLTAPLLASLAAAAPFLAFAHLLIKRRRETDRLAAARIAALQEKIGAALQDGFDQAAPESFTTMLRTASLTTGLQAPRLQTMAGMDKQAPEKYRILARLASQGMGADEIAAALGISHVEAGQLLSLSRMAGSGRGQAAYPA